MASNTVPGPKEPTLGRDRLFARPIIGCGGKYSGLDQSTRDAIRDASPDYRRAQMQHCVGMLDDANELLSAGAQVALDALSELEAWEAVERVRAASRTTPGCQDGTRRNRGSR